MAYIKLHNSSRTVFHIKVWEDRPQLRLGPNESHTVHVPDEAAQAAMISRVQSFCRVGLRIDTNQDGQAAQESAQDAPDNTAAVEMLLSAPELKPPQGSGIFSRYTTLVMRGGGSKGIGYLGALWLLERHGFDPTTVVGASAGAAAAALMAAGLSAKDMISAFAKFDIASTCQVPAELGTVPIEERVAKYGFAFDSTELSNWVNTQVQDAKLSSDFADFGKKAKRRLVLTITKGTQLLIVDSKFQPFPLSVGEIVQASCAIPILFRPTPIGRQVLADGGIIANFPWAPFIVYEMRRNQSNYAAIEQAMLGLSLGAPTPTTEEGPFFSLIDRVIEAAINGGEASIAPADAVIRVSPGPVGTMSLGLQADGIRALLNNGFDAANEWLRQRGVVTSSVDRTEFEDLVLAAFPDGQARRSDPVKLALEGGAFRNFGIFWGFACALFPRLRARVFLAVSTCLLVVACSGAGIGAWASYRFGKSNVCGTHPELSDLLAMDEGNFRACVAWALEKGRCARHYEILGSISGRDESRREGDEFKDFINQLTTRANLRLKPGEDQVFCVRE